MKSFDGIDKKAEEYAQLGREDWLRRQAKMADEGFEAHTGK